ncbi:flagellar biosynthesis protein FlhB [Comamonas sp. BIGb0152]|uniref:hypothetical protein n=1 Tax=Comamonas sp. BIGb0152 TaxID=2940601 RepID=UPI0021690EA0|nr:hypothetical protein [Comamonas sp. BIGb0152]MCS4295344.1 flagellar biosynthesis protein FlhB [Comamonas sp. BIGb0152]
MASSLYAAICLLTLPGLEKLRHRHNMGSKRCNTAMKGSALNELLATVVSWTLRIVMVLAGLVFFVSLMVVAAIAALLWTLRLLWAKMTGKPIVPFAFKMNPATGWTTVYRSTARWSANKGARSAEAASNPSGMRSAVIDVTDVEPREIRSQH